MFALVESNMANVPSLSGPNDLPKLPFRKESYTTWLYVGLAVASVVTMILGFWLAGAPNAGP